MNLSRAIDVHTWTTPCVHTLNTHVPTLKPPFWLLLAGTVQAPGAGAELANKLAVVRHRHHARACGERVDHQPQGSHHARSTALAQP